MKKKISVTAKLAEERTLLSNERTMLAYLRTAFTALVFGFALLQFSVLKPQLRNIGLLIIAGGFLFIIAGLIHYKILKKKIKHEVGDD